MTYMGSLRSPGNYSTKTIYFLLYNTRIMMMAVMMAGMVVTGLAVK